MKVGPVEATLKEILIVALIVLGLWLVAMFIMAAITDAVGGAVSSAGSGILSALASPFQAISNWFSNLFSGGAQGPPIDGGAAVQAIDQGTPIQQPAPTLQAWGNGDTTSDAASMGLSGDSAANADNTWSNQQALTSSNGPVDIFGTGSDSQGGSDGSGGDDSGDDD